VWLVVVAINCWRRPTCLSSSRMRHCPCCNFSFFLSGNSGSANKVISEQELAVSVVPAFAQQTCKTCLGTKSAAWASKQEGSRSPTFVLKKVSRRAAPVQNLQDVHHCDLCCNLLRFAENTACFGGLTCPDQQLISETFVLSRCISKHRADLNQSSFTKHASTRALCTLRLWYWC